jgi:hypothetical protein
MTHNAVRKIDNDTYEFFGVCPGETNCLIDREVVKESDLTQQHRDFFLGVLLNAWDKSPKMVQHEFLYMLSEGIKGKYEEHFNMIFPFSKKDLEE